MKVIHAAQMTWTGNVVCTSCHSELEVELSDLRRDTGGDQRDHWDNAVFTCPVCGKPSSSSALLQSIPTHLRDKLPRAR